MEFKEKAPIISSKLEAAFGEPLWRNPLPPLDELISTILSQNTNDTNRDRAFNSLKKRLPTWENVRDAAVEDVIDAIRPAGLANQKGPRIQNVLLQITRERGALDLSFLQEMDVEDARAWLIQFKGVGPKTAAIVLLFSLGKPAFPVDTHVHRVTGRIGLRPQTMNADQSHTFLEGLFPADRYYTLHLNLIRLGREICKARKPDCLVCPLSDDCCYYHNNISETTDQSKKV